MCSECGESFTREEYLERHLQNQHRKGDSYLPKQQILELAQPELSPLQPDANLSPIQHCSSEYPSVKPRPHMCPTCGKSFTRKQHVRRHLDIHQRQKDATKVCDPVSLVKTTVDRESICFGQNSDYDFANFGLNLPFSSAHAGLDPVPCKLFQNVVNTPPSNPSQKIMNPDSVEKITACDSANSVSNPLSDSTHLGLNLPSSDSVHSVANWLPPKAKGHSSFQHSKLRPGRHVCPECGRCFRRKQNMQRHSKMHDRQNGVHAQNSVESVADPLQCESVNFPPCNSIPLPPRSQHQPHFCPVCGQIFTRKHHMQIHLLIHLRQKDAVNLTFSVFESADTKANFQLYSSAVNPLPSEAIQHSTAKPRPHMCFVCGKCFGRKHHMQRHLLLHNHQKNGANSTVTTASSLVSDLVHSSTHPLPSHADSAVNTVALDVVPLSLRIRPFLCPACGKNFIRKHHMERHFEIHKRQRGSDGSQSVPSSV